MTTGFVFGDLGKGNVNYSGKFTFGSVGVGLFGGFRQTGSVNVYSASIGATLLSEVLPATAAVGGTLSSKPVPLGSV